jgi:hypothetical protein
MEGPPAGLSQLACPAVLEAQKELQRWWREGWQTVPVAGADLRTSYLPGTDTEALFPASKCFMSRGAGPTLYHISYPSLELSLQQTAEAAMAVLYHVDVSITSL